MAKPRSRFVDLTVYVVIRLVTSFLLVLTLEQAHGFARLLGWLAYKLNKRHRNVALENLKTAFGDELDDAARERMVRQTYVHFCTMVVDMLHYPRNLHPHNWRHWITVHRLDL